MIESYAYLSITDDSEIMRDCREIMKMAAYKKKEKNISVPKRITTFSFPVACKRKIKTMSYTIK